MKGIKNNVTYSRIMLLLLAFQLILLSYCNFVRVPYRFDHDAAVAVRHAVDMWREGTIFLPDFICSSTFEIDCVSFFAAPLYILTGSLGFSLGVVHIIVGCIALFYIFGIIRNLRLPLEYCALAALLVFTPYAQGQTSYVNMLFYSVGQYEFRMICMLSLLFLLGWDRGKSKLYYAAAAISAMFFFITGLSAGIYILAVSACPFILYEVFEVIQKQRFSLKNSNWLVLALCFLSGICGSLIHMLNSNLIIKNPFILITQDHILDNFLSILTGIWNLLGGVSDRAVPVFSFQGIAVTINFVVVTFIVILVFTVTHSMDLKQYKKFICRVFTMIAVNMVILLLLDNGARRAGEIALRYHILWVIGLFLVFVVCLYLYMEQEKNIWKKNTLRGLILAGIVCINFAGGYRVGRGYDVHYDIAQELMDVLPEYSDSELMLYYTNYEENAAACKVNAFNLDQYIYLVTASEDGVPARLVYGGYDHPQLKENNLLVINKAKAGEISEKIMEQYHLVDETETWGLYRSERNPWINSQAIH